MPEPVTVIIRPNGARTEIRNLADLGNLASAHRQVFAGLITAGGAVLAGGE